ncbi:formin-like protein 5 isoform X1 [Iris pallida]|uniref:Formin-like protein 5 isoform X1 n=1 Tax=Iris pallida TaxID=29817 RepID=A0AAX6GAL3_IRIPA|nr:formin-like protein 5 isoform X1 [Iris pallida]
MAAACYKPQPPPPFYFRHQLLQGRRGHAPPAVGDHRRPPWVRPLLFQHDTLRLLSPQHATNRSHHLHSISATSSSKVGRPTVVEAARPRALAGEARPRSHLRVAAAAARPGAAAAQARLRAARAGSAAAPPPASRPSWPCPPRCGRSPATPLGPPSSLPARRIGDSCVLHDVPS